MRAQVIWDTRQNRFPRAPLRGACGVVDPAQSGMAPAFRLSTRKETTMIDLYDHIQELRAELRGCRFTRRERAAVEAELARPSGNRPSATVLSTRLSQPSTGRQKRQGAAA